MPLITIAAKPADDEVGDPPLGLVLLTAIDQLLLIRVRVRQRPLQQTTRVVIQRIFLGSSSQQDIHRAAVAEQRDQTVYDGKRDGTLVVPKHPLPRTVLAPHNARPMRVVLGITHDAENLPQRNEHERHAAKHRNEVWAKVQPPKPVRTLELPQAQAQAQAQYRR